MTLFMTATIDPECGPLTAAALVAQREWLNGAAKPKLCRDILPAGQAIVWLPEPAGDFKGWLRITGDKTAVYGVSEGLRRGESRAFLVRKQSDKRGYVVRCGDGPSTCECDSAKYRSNEMCKHRAVIEALISNEWV